MNKYLIIIVLIIILLLVIYNTNLNNVKNITELVEKGTDGKAGTQGIQGTRGPRGYPGKDATSDIGKVIKRKDKNIGIGTNEPESNLELHGFMNMVGTKGTGKTNNHTFTSYYPAGKSNPRYASVGFLEKDSKDFTLLNENEEGSINIKNKTGSFMMGADGETLLKNGGGSFGIDNEGKVDFKNKNGSVILDKDGNTSISNNLDLSKNLKVGGNVDISKNMKVSENVNFGKNLKVADSISAKGLNVSNDINAKGLNVSNLNISKNLGVGTNKPKSKLHVDNGAVIVTDGHKPAVEGNTQFYTGQKGHYVFRKLGPNHTLKHDGSNDLMTINSAGQTHIKGDFHARSNITLNTHTASGRANHPNGWIFHAPRDKRKTLFIAPHNKGWDWAKQTTINGKNGDVNVQAKLHVKGKEITPFFRGMVMAFNGNVAPPGWALCDGRTIKGYKTPDLRGRFVLGSGKPNNNNNGKWDGNSAGYPSGYHFRTGQRSGEWKHRLNQNEIPPHNHVFPGDDWIRAGHGKGGWTNRTTGGFNYDARSALGGAGRIYRTSDSGGNQPHNNMPPYYVLTYIVKL